MAEDNKDWKDYENTTDTDLDLLHRIESAWKKNFGENAKRNSAKSMDWFRKYVTKNFSQIRLPRVQRDRSLFKSKLIFGKMYLAQYDAKHKDTLPVWDAWPLFIPFSSYKSKAGAEIVVGLNFHYLPPKLRMIAFQALLKFRTEKRYRRSTKLDFDWEVISAISQSRLFEHAVHAYDVKHFRSMYIEMPSKSWEIVLFLPLARWQNGSKQKAWSL